MISSQARSGELPQIDLLQEPPVSSLNSAWFTEQWLLSSGVVSEHSINTLMMYAYAQPEVYKARIEIDRDDAHDGESPVCRYFIRIKPMDDLKLSLVKKVQSIKRPIVRKFFLFLAVKFGAPVGIDSEIIRFAKEYLPPKWRVEVVIE